MRRLPRCTRRSRENDIHREESAPLGKRRALLDWERGPLPGFSCPCIPRTGRDRVVLLQRRRRQADVPAETRCVRGFRRRQRAEQLPDELSFRVGSPWELWSQQLHEVRGRRDSPLSLGQRCQRDISASVRNLTLSSTRLFIVLATERFA